jgi:hypothetical protein
MNFAALRDQVSARRRGTTSSNEQMLIGVNHYVTNYAMLQTTLEVDYRLGFRQRPKVPV